MSSEGFREQDLTFATRAIHEAQEPEQWESMAVVPPISLATTFKQYGPADFKAYEYGRSGNPTRNTLEKVLASLEGAKHGLILFCVLYCFLIGSHNNILLYRSGILIWAWNFNCHRAHAQCRRPYCFDG